MSIHISCDTYVRLGLHVKIRLYYVLPYKAKILAQHGIGFILDRCIVYLGLIMQNLQKKRLLIFEIFIIKKCTLLLLEPSIIIDATYKRENHKRQSTSRSFENYFLSMEYKIHSEVETLSNRQRNR